MTDLVEAAARPSASPVPLAAMMPGRAPRDDSVRRLLFRTRTGRLFWLALLARAVAGQLHAWWPGSGLAEALTIVAGLGLAVTLAILLVRLAGIARRRLLWRVRRKLILSYVFIGVVPVILVVAFFLFAGALMFLHVSAYLFKRGFDDLIDEATVVAETTAVELSRAGQRDGQAIIDRKADNASTRYPALSLALVPRAGTASAGPMPAIAGPWHHADPPASVPDWVPRTGFGGLLAYAPADGAGDPRVVVRAVRWIEGRTPARAVVVDLPVDARLHRWLRDQTGITLTGVGVLSLGEGARPAVGRPRPEAAEPEPVDEEDEPGRWSLNSLTFFDYTDWTSGQTGTISMGIRVSVGDIYQRLLAAQSRLGRLTLGELFFVVLTVVAVLFLIIEAAALVMGFALARSITGSIHALFDGTQRVRRGDFGHRIAVRTADQLGELADSFNQMTASIETLLRQAEEKRRLEEELRIAREIQMSLLPSQPILRDGVVVSGFCMPAREVGGDYFDFFPLDAHRIGLLIADVSGKGTSAALYMAELKGLLLSLSKIHDSPKRLLVEVNQIIADHLDSRSFITMTYAVLDLRARRLTYARAGHTPLIHGRPGSDGRHRVEAHAPSGIVVGLRIDGVAAKFESLLHECTLQLAEGDLVVLYTDGVSEAMNPAADLFGDEQLLALVAEDGHLPSDALRQRIFAKIETFVAGADQHDDMTMIIVKVEAQAANRADAAAMALAGGAPS